MPGHRRLRPGRIGREGRNAVRAREPERSHDDRLSGTGVAPNPIPDGAARLTGKTEAGYTLTCSPASFPLGTRFRYQWLRNRARLGGATAQSLALTDADVGARFSCRLRATAPGGTQTVVSPDSHPTAALDLSLLPGGMVDEGVCRTVSAPALLPGAVHMVFRNPITPWALLLVYASSPMDVALDGRALGSSTNVNVTPRTLARFGDGRHTLQVRVARSTDRAVLTLAPCQLAASLRGIPDRWSDLNISARTGISMLTAVLSRGLNLALPRQTLGQMTFHSAGLSGRSFYLTAARTVYHGVTVSAQSAASRSTSAGYRLKSGPSICA